MSKQDLILFLTGGGAAGGLYKLWQYFFSMKKMRRDDYLEDQEVITQLSDKLKREISQSAEDLVEFAEKLRSITTENNRLEEKIDALGKKLRDSELLITELKTTIKSLRDEIEEIQKKK